VLAGFMCHTFSSNLVYYIRPLTRLEDPFGLFAVFHSLVLAYPSWTSSAFFLCRQLAVTVYWHGTTLKVEVLSACESIVLCGLTYSILIGSL
jgi:hypothetical protein